jgi:Na+/phosphate symporter
LEKQALRDASQSDDEAVVAFRERVNKTTKLSIFGAFIATICISLLSLAQASFTSPSKLTEYTYVALYLALVVSLNATAISGMDAVMLENTRVDIRRVCYLHASFIFRTVPVMLSVASSFLVSAILHLVWATQPVRVAGTIIAICMCMLALLLGSLVVSTILRYVPRR